MSCSFATALQECRANLASLSSLADIADLIAALAALATFGAAIGALIIGKRGVEKQIKEQRNITKRQLEEQQKITERQLEEQQKIKAEQIEEGREISRIERVARYVATTHETEFLKRTEVVNGLLELGEAKGKAAWEQMNEENRLRVFAFFNFFEEMASAYHGGLLNKEMAREYIAYYAYGYWEFADWFIEWQRQRNRRYYEQWQRLYDDVRGEYEA